MHCGVCVRDRGPRSLLPKWLLRPVVATFHGYGKRSYTLLHVSFTREFVAWSFMRVGLTCDLFPSLASSPGNGTDTYSADGFSERRFDTF